VSFEEKKIDDFAIPASSSFDALSSMVTEMTGAEASYRDFPPCPLHRFIYDDAGDDVDVDGDDNADDVYGDVGGDCDGGCGISNSMHSRCMLRHARSLKTCLNGTTTTTTTECHLTSTHFGSLRTLNL
jgi:hypothetical protein